MKRVLTVLVAPLLGAGLLLCCSPEAIVPLETVTIRVDARDPFGARPDGPLGVALLWTTSSTIYASSEVPLAANQNAVIVPLSFPRPRPPGLFFAELMLIEESIVVHVPRIAVYRDDDGSGGFTPWNLEEPPADRIVAVNGQGATAVGAVRNLEAALNGLSAVDVNRYYELTGGKHTPFLLFPGATSTLTSDLLIALGPPVVSLYFDDSDVPERDIRCINASRFDPEPRLARLAETRTSSRSFTVRVDSRIDPESVCGLDLPDCGSVDITTVTTTVPDDLRTPGRRIISQCRASATFESLVTLRAELECRPDCSCGWIERHEALVVRTSSTPPGWPCGDTVPFCPSDLSLVRADESCAL